MTNTIVFTTARGSKIYFGLITERENLADHRFMSRCWDIDCKINDGMPEIWVSREDHPDYGPCLTMAGGKIVPIPADALAAVDAIWQEYTAGVDARHQASIAAETSPAVQLSNKLTADMDRPDSDL